VRPIYRTGVPLSSKCCISYIFSTNISTEYFKHAAHPPFFSSKCRHSRRSTKFQNHNRNHNTEDRTEIYSRCPSSLQHRHRVRTNRRVSQTKNVKIRFSNLNVYSEVEYMYFIKLPFANVHTTLIFIRQILLFYFILFYFIFVFLRQPSRCAVIVVFLLPSKKHNVQYQ
jgi:hypothetical protein